MVNGIWDVHQKDINYTWIECQYVFLPSCSCSVDLILILLFFLFCFGINLFFFRKDLWFIFSLIWKNIEKKKDWQHESPTHTHTDNNQTTEQNTNSVLQNIKFFKRILFEKKNYEHRILNYCFVVCVCVWFFFIIWCITSLMNRKFTFTHTILQWLFDLKNEKKFFFFLKKKPKKDWCNVIMILESRI